VFAGDATMTGRMNEFKDFAHWLERLQHRHKVVIVGKILELHKQANQVELELEQNEEALAAVDDEIADIEALQQERVEYEDRRTQITDQ
jgi:DNA-binding transcriptional regulator GbsR (MarR family)